jgi:hypothetical protein
VRNLLLSQLISIRCWFLVGRSLSVTPANQRTICSHRKKKLVTLPLGRRPNRLFGNWRRRLHRNGTVHDCCCCDRESTYWSEVSARASLLQWKHVKPILAHSLRAPPRPRPLDVTVVVHATLITSPSALAMTARAPATRQQQQQQQQPRADDLQRNTRAASPCSSTALARAFLQPTDDDGGAWKRSMSGLTHARTQANKTAVGRRQRSSSTE